jgi:hypothetical protein
MVSLCLIMALAMRSPALRCLPRRFRRVDQAGARRKKQRCECYGRYPSSESHLWFLSSRVTLRQIRLGCSDLLSASYTQWV